MPETSRGTRASERLRRMLVVVPYLVEHPGTEVAEAGRLFQISEPELVKDLEVLFMSGLPPYSPGDLVEVDIEEGRIWITMADHFARPLRLTRNEALSLYLHGTALAASPDLSEAHALRSALEKLRVGLGPDELGQAVRVEAATGGRPAHLLHEVRSAAADHRSIEISYHAGSSGETTVRLIDPEEVFAAIGNWYVAAWDHASGEERLFRIDRIRDVRRTEGSFEPRGIAGAGRPLYSPAENDVQVRLRLYPDARWIAEYYETDEANELPDGSLEVSLPAGRLDQIAMLVLSASPSVEVLSPPELVRRVGEIAGAALARYR